ncbi:LysR family transcriptional regulator [Vibrio hepatarius]|uniref:LysR family transcriptional regulator n=1 Tax=Vibrio hepatarius TaxID=171383 RepID=UPI00148C91C8|nr:LysR family transcriptional regulator [Vibrio hepatarius]NOI14498.1 LysR family transcriptional regulator [Vibrio hepatarius]
MQNTLWLNTFKTLVEVGHFTQTAEKLHMTQPGVSQHIKKLEESCGHNLLKREKKSFELTEQGRLVYQYALKLAEDEALLLENLRFDDPYAGQCKLSCSGSLALLLYPQLLSLQQSHPELTIHLEAAPNHKILDDVQVGVIDLGIVTHQPNSALYQSQVIGEEALCLVFPRAYADKPLSAELLAECGFVGHPDAKHYLSLYFDACQSDALTDINLDQLPQTGYINQLHQILLAVAKGLGFTVLPAAAIESFHDKERLYIVDTQAQVRETLYLVQKRHRDLPQRYQTIRQVLETVLKQH